VTHHRPIWDRGDAIDAAMLAFTVGDDWRMDQRLVEHDIAGSLAHAAGLCEAGLLDAADHAAIARGLTELLAEHRAGAWDVEPGDEDVHSAVERRLIARIGDAGKRLHTGRSRNEQVAVDVALWLRAAVARTGEALGVVREACEALARRSAGQPLPGYTHLRRAMPSSVADWARAHAKAFACAGVALEHVGARLVECPLGSGAGYGVPLELARASVAARLGFERAAEPVTHVQHARGRAELAYLGALEEVALDVEKLAVDLWLFSTSEFGFVRLPTAFTTGSSLMPQKRNPDVLELVRAHARQITSDRAALLDVLRGLPSGYHRDFQLLKPPLFRAHDRAQAVLALLPSLLDALEFDAEALARADADPALRATQRALERMRSGVPFRDAYRAESSSSAL
jgi:argininosuccinate lyase